MSRYVLEAVAFLRGIPATPKAVLTSLAAHAHHDGSNACPSQRLIADETGASLRSVARGLAWLERAGYIIPTGHDGGGRARAVEYQIVVERLPLWQGFNPQDTQKVATMAGYQDVNLAKSNVNLAKSAQNLAIVANESGRESIRFNQREERAERAQRASASFVSSFEKKKESRDQSRERELLAPYDDAEWMELPGDVPLTSERDMLLTLCACTEEASPHRAWLQCMPTFLETHATADQLLIGYAMMREQFADMEHKPGVRKLAEHWDEWQSKAKAHIAKVNAEEAYFEAQRQRNLREEEAVEREREIRAAEKARRDALTPEERAAEDAEIARQEEEARAVRERLHAERMAYMRAKTAPRGEAM